MPAIDVTPGPDGYRVWLSGRVFASFATLSNAARCASCLTGLARIGALQASNHLQQETTL